MDKLKQLEKILTHKANVIDKVTHKMICKDLLSDEESTLLKELTGKYIAYHEVLNIIERIKE